MHGDDATISPELAVNLAELDPIDRPMHPDLVAAIVELDAALEGLTGEARRRRAARFRFRGAGHVIRAVPDLPPDEP